MKAAKIICGILAAYALVVIIFESLLGYYQPSDGQTLVITTTDSAGEVNDRVLSKIDIDGTLYVAANHWPRAWYNAALDNPDVEITIGDETNAYVAVPIEGAEHDKVDSAHPLGAVIRILTGFPPRYFLRLDPV